jgi:predicted PP-loop superfamily ATPase
MTAQEHIDAIGRALAKSEEAVKATRKALRLVEEHHAILHARLDKAQKAYMATRDGENIVAFSGGTDKPPVNDPDKPVKP